MTDPMKKVRTGDPLVIPARAYNAFVDVARHHQAQRHGITQPARPARCALPTLRIRNDSGLACDRFDILGLDCPVITPADNPQAFANDLVLSGITPAAHTHEGRFVVLAEPLEAGRIGRAYAMGLCPVRVDITDTDHTAAEIDDGVVGHLVSADQGSAAIIWRADATTGLQWAVVRLNAGGSGLPSGTGQYKVLQLNASDEPTWDWVRAHA